MKKELLILSIIGFVLISVSACVFAISCNNNYDSYSMTYQSGINGNAQTEDYINCIFFCSSMYFSGGLLPVFCKTVKNPDTYVKLASKGCCYTNWKQVGEGLYLNIDNICYYKDKEGNKHALITEKLMKDNQMSAVDKICIERFKKPFHYCHFIKDINLNGKTETLLFMGFHTDDEYLGGISFDKNNPENTSRFEVCQLYQYLMDNSNSN